MPAPVVTYNLDLRKVDRKIKTMIVSAPSMAARSLYTSARHTLVPAIRAKIRENKSVFRGELHQRTEARSLFKTANEAAIEVGPLGVPHGRAVEEGTTPHTPNKKKILEYVRKKMGVTGRQAYALATAIMKTIEAAGTKPHPYIEPAWEATKETFWADFLVRMERGGH